MTMNSPKPAPGTTPFRPDGVVTLADVAARAEAELEGTARRDTRSAFATLAAKLDLNLPEVPATPERVRAVIGDLTPGRLGVSAKRLANIRSLVVRAVERFGMRRRVVTRAVPLTQDWEALLARVEPRTYAHGLNRLAAFCSATGVAPEAVGPETLRDLHAALEAECFVKRPRMVLKRTIALWNICARRIAGWPQAQLRSPFATEPDTLPLDAFPESFRAGIAAWTARMTEPDLLDPDAPARPLKPATVASYVVVFRRFASALVRRGVLPVEEITGLGVLFEGERFREAARHFLPESPGRTTAHLHAMATQLHNVARHHLKLPADRLEGIEAIVDRLDPKLPRGMGRRHRDRLDQFDDPETVRRLLAFPEEEAARARAATSAVRRAKGIERALAISILIHAGLRIRNLRQIRLDRTIRRAGGRVFLDIAAEETKTGTGLELELPAETVALLDAFLGEHRALLPGSDGPWLFAGTGGGPRSDNAMRAAVSEPLWKHAGIRINPHLYRHAISKIVVERHPEMYVAVSRRLGHRSIDTTLASYLGTETRAASRQISRLLDRARSDPGLED